MVKFRFETEEVIEGKAHIIVPKADRGKGPGKKEKFPFFNPVMEPNRDISVLVVQKAFAGRPSCILDGLSGSGVRGIRLALEVDGDVTVVLNDWNELCYELIRENLHKNRIRNAEARQEDLRHLLEKEQFDYVDVDPFGTPVHFTERALKGVVNGGILAVTATDTAALAGSYPDACKRKYDAASLPAPTRHEIGIRILIGHIARTARSLCLGIKTLFCHSTDHYYRAYVRVAEDLEMEGEIGCYSKNPTTLENILTTDEEDNHQTAGPLWIGELWDRTLLTDLRLKSYMSSKTSKTLELIRNEARFAYPYYSSDEIASKLRTLTPSIGRILESLRERGYDSSPTHFDPKGFRTNAPINDIKDIFRGL